MCMYVVPVTLFASLLHSVNAMLGVQDTFDAMFGDIGQGSRVSMDPSPESLQGGRRVFFKSTWVEGSNTVTNGKGSHASAHPSLSSCLHPDTLMPLPRNHDLISVATSQATQNKNGWGRSQQDVSRTSQTQRESHGIDAEGGWAVGFVVQDFGVIRQVVPGTPADLAKIIHESSSGLWQVRVLLMIRSVLHSFVMFASTSSLMMLFP